MMITKGKILLRKLNYRTYIYYSNYIKKVQSFSFLIWVLVILKIYNMYLKINFTVSGTTSLPEYQNECE